MDFRKIVAAEIRRKKITPYRLAKLLGYKRPDPVYAWLNGTRGLPAARVEAMFNILKIGL